VKFFEIVRLFPLTQAGMHWLATDCLQAAIGPVLARAFHKLTVTGRDGGDSMRPKQRYAKSKQRCDN
jgi:hypothetical protein